MRLAKIIDGKKFMWDGREYKDEVEARNIMKKYKADGFEVRMIKEENKFYIFTRRVVTEVKVEGVAPG